NLFIQGSTYEHNFDMVKTDLEGAKYLENKLKRMLPKLANRSKLKAQWVGVRMSTPNRKPIVGQHPKFKNLYLFTGFGSKGLLYSKFIANHFADYLIKEEPLWDEVSIDRMEMD